MSLHDAYARVTPYEIAFQDAEHVAELASTVNREAGARGVDVHDLQGFLTLGTVDAFVRGLAGTTDDPATLHRFGPLAFHAVHFTHARSPLFLLSTHVARYLVEGAPEGSPRPPRPAGYLQLPQHLFWTGAAGEAPESIDGVFWTATPPGSLHALLVTGIRPDRPGLGVVPLPPAPLRDAPRWLDVDARDGERDFSTELPGAELDILYGVEAAGEAFKLLARFFAYVDAAPDALEEHEAFAESEGEGPTPSVLPFIRVSIGE